VSSEKLTDYTVTLESNLAHYQKEPDSYSWKKQVDHLGPSGPRDSRAKPSGSLGPPWAQGIQEPKPSGSLGPQWPKGFKSKTKWITWAPMGPRDSRAKEPKSLRQQHQGTRLPKAL
jgi:hypothetical protein